MTVLAVCENCGHRFETKLKPRETIQCPNCKCVFNMLKVMNDPDNAEAVKLLNSKSSQPKE